MSRLVPFRFVVQASLLELDDDGEPIYEHPQQALVLYGRQQVLEWLDELPETLDSPSFAPVNGQPQ